MFETEESTNTDTKTNKSGIFTVLTKATWIAFTALIIAIPLYVLSVNNNWYGLYGGMPSLQALQNPENELSSELYSADNVLLGKYYRENRSEVKFEDLSPNLINALVATEDIRFAEHSGIDLISMSRVLYGITKYILTFGNSKLEGGGSTLTQQTAKNLFRTRGNLNNGTLSNKNRYLDLLVQKTKEWILAARLEKYYTKKEILALYLNTAEFGSNSYGIKVAAKTYFNKKPIELEVEEAAVLVGLLKAVTYYNPQRNPENSTRRRNVVLAQMQKYDFIPKDTLDSLQQVPITLDYKVDSHNEGLAPYFRTVVRNFLVNWSNEHGYDLFEDGLRIYTTIDSRMQEHAEKAVNNHMEYLQGLFDEHWEDRNPWIDEEGDEIKGFIKNVVAPRSDRYRSLKKQFGRKKDSINYYMNKPVDMTVFSWNGEIDTLMSPMDSLSYYMRFLHTGFMSMNPHNGHIKAWVGGINHKYFKFDHVKQGRRQPGSTFKPFLYTAVIDQGYSPCYQVDDLPVTFKVYTDEKEDTWTPVNSGNEYSGETMTIRQAMSRSVNSITAYMLKKLGEGESGPRMVVDYARRMGIESPLDPVPSIVLGGAGDVSVYELIGAYGTFANKGVWTEPVYITRIEDKDGNVLQQFPAKTREAISEETAYIMLHMLKGSSEEEGGTSVRLGRNGDLLEDNEIGAKTGTTSNYSDGWFVGVTQDLVSGAWVGGDRRSIHFRNIRYGQGAVMALPIFKQYMEMVYEDERLDYKKQEFEKPRSGLSVEINCDNLSNGYFTKKDSVEAEQENKLSVDDIF
jgi:penicillin-binding protein 1A